MHAYVGNAAALVHSCFCSLCKYLRPMEESFQRAAGCMEALLDTCCQLRLVAASEKVRCRLGQNDKQSSSLDVIEGQQQHRHHICVMG
jgi:hypothetical protein